MITQRLPKTLVEIQWDYWFGKLIEITSQNVGGIMDGIASPVQPFAVTIWRIKNLLQVLDALRGATEPEDTLNIGSYKGSIRRSQIRM
jgi:hypothetical protein